MLNQKSIHTSLRYFVIFVYLVVLGIFFVLVLALYRWQIVYFDKFNTLAKTQIYQQNSVISKRGTVYTADGMVLAADQPTWDLIVSISNKQDYKRFFEPSNFTKFKKIVKEILNKDISYLQDKSLDKLAYIVIAEGLTKADMLKIKGENFVGVYFKQNIKRIYPNGTLASHVIGFVGRNVKGEPIGLYGVEGFFWGDLKGKAGIIKREKSINGQTLAVGQYKQALLREGKNIMLTIRSGLQAKVEQVLAKQVKKFKAKSGSVIIMNPHTGEIIAMANYPTYDPNIYWKYKDLRIFKNLAVSSVYEYGSVQKPLTLAMALQEKIIDKKYKCNDTGSLKVLDKVVYNWAYAKYGWIDLLGILEHSDNVCAAKVGLKIGAKTMYSYFKKLGIGHLLNIGLQDEETGYLKDCRLWNKADVAVASFGQMVSATPLQVLSALSTIANHGIRMQPFIVKKIFSSEEEIDFKPYVAEKVFSREVADHIAFLMFKATMKQREWRRYRGVYEVAGKTGTAQIPKKDGIGYEEDKVNTTFVGFVPYKEPAIIMLVRLEEPQKYQLASKTAVPAWQAIFDVVKDELGVPQAGN